MVNCNIPLTCSLVGPPACADMVRAGAWAMVLQAVQPLSLFD